MAIEPSKTTKADRTKLKIALTAERLVAELGLGAVSARMVSREAGLGNNSSLHYHFGSLESVFEFLIRYRIQILDGIRRDMMDRSGTVLTLDQLVEFICLPHFQLVDDAGRYPYAGFLSEYLSLRYPGGFPWIMEAPSRDSTALVEIIGQLRMRLPDLPLNLFQRRVANATLLFVNVLRGSRPDDNTPALHPDDPVIIDTLRQAAGLLMS